MYLRNTQSILYLTSKVVVAQGAFHKGRPHNLTHFRPPSPCVRKIWPLTGKINSTVHIYQTPLFIADVLYGRPPSEWAGTNTPLYNVPGLPRAERETYLQSHT